jgi:hypothetical protein
LAFFPRGTSCTGSVTLENTAGTQVRLVINGFGRVKIESL